jgi:hypothetical protein
MYPPEYGDVNTNCHMFNMLHVRKFNLLFIEFLVTIVLDSVCLSITRLGDVPQLIFYDVTFLECDVVVECYVKFMVFPHLHYIFWVVS